MDELSKEEPGPSAPDPLTWNPSDAIMYARKSKRVGPQKSTLIGIKETYTQNNNNNYCPFSFIIVIRVTNWHISPNLNILEPWSHYLQILRLRGL